MNNPKYISAIDSGNVKEIKKMLASGWDPQKEIRSPLNYACLRAKPEIVRVLLDVGLPLGYPACPMHAACMGTYSLERLQVIDLLLQEKGNLLDLWNPAERTPLMCAAAQGDLDLMLALMNRGASHKDVNSNGKSVRDFFAMAGPGAKEKFDALIMEMQTPKIKKTSRKSVRL